MSKIAVLFLCTGNSARSQMAETFLRRYGDGRFEAYSARLEPKAIHPLTRQVMAEIGYELDGQYAKDVIEYMGKQHFGYLITVCAQAERNCPRTFPDVSQRLHWDIDDPAAADGSDEEKLAVFRRVRDELEARIKAWVATVASEINAPRSRV